MSEPEIQPETAPSRARARLLLFSVLVVATCGLVYELLAGTLASYVLGDSVTQFSLVIGLYLSAMGVGAWLSRFLEEDLAARVGDLFDDGLQDDDIDRAPVVVDLDFGLHVRPVLLPEGGDNAVLQQQVQLRPIELLRVRQLTNRG